MFQKVFNRKNKKKFFIKSFIVAILCIPFLSVKSQNPFIRNMYIADPSAHVWADGRLYLYPSHDIFTKVSHGCDSMDRYHVFSTDDMIHWKDHGEILNASQVPWGRTEGGFMWAPDCAYKNGTYYFYYPHPSGTDWGKTWKIGVATSTRPDSGFVDKGYISGLESMIDPCVFVDDDGQAYFYYGGGGTCKGGKLKDNMLEIDGAMQTMTGLSDFHEATWVHKRNGLYYLSYADNNGNGGNQMRYATSANPLGPWTYQGVYIGPTGSSTDHGSIVEFKGKWYAFYHNSSLSLDDWLRSACVDTLHYNADGTIAKVIQTKGESQSIAHGTPYGGIAQQVPGTIEAENFDEGGRGVAYVNNIREGNLGGQHRLKDSVGVENCGLGGYDVGFTHAGEWLEYTVNVTKTDSYIFDTRVASDSKNGGSYHIEIDGVDTTGILTVPWTGGWQFYQSVIKEGIVLSEGKHYVKFYFNSGGFNIDKIIVSHAGNDLSQKLMMGYQGWFLCKGDGSAPNEWRHWFRSLTDPSISKLNIDLWPEMSEYKKTYTTSMTYSNGSPATLFSSHDSSTTNLHFKWMKDYGIYGVYLQRFLGEIADNRFFQVRNNVLKNVINASQKYDRHFAVMYDISGVADDGNLVSKLLNDWRYLVNTYDVTNKQGYVKQNQLPVLAIWGIGFSERGLKPETFKALIDSFHHAANPAYRAYIVGGVPGQWRTLDSDSESDSAWLEVYHSLDMISPWAVGRYGDNTSADNWKNQRVVPDLNDCNTHGVDYMPVIFPGFSWYNMHDRNSNNPLNQIRRNGGKFYWRQAYNVLKAGSKFIYVAMFDEVDEGTAMFKVARNIDYAPDKASFVTLDKDGYALPSDWYLRLAGETQKMLEGNLLLTDSINIKSPLIAVTKVSLNLSSDTIAVGDKVQLIAGVSPVQATDKGVRWSSGDTTVAKVDQNGLVTAIAVGSTSVLVKSKDGTKSATCRIVVTKATSINDLNSDQTNIDIFPVPTKDFVSLKYNLPQASPFLVEVYDLKGTMVKTLKGMAQSGFQTTVMNIQEMVSGVYLVKFKTSDFVAIKKMIIK